MSRRSPGSRRGFSLIELLVVIAIIAAILAILLPAVQKVREASARAKCSNNLKQLSLAMFGYHDTHDCLPIGSRGSPHQTWTMYIWPHLEQNNLGNGLNLDMQNYYSPPCTEPNSLEGRCATPVAQYYCPSDEGIGCDQTDGLYRRTRGNYVVNWGQCTYPCTGNAPAPAGPGMAPFSHKVGSLRQPRPTRITDITDGRSETLLMSEYLRAKTPEDVDWRGDIHSDDGVFKFMTFTTPNSTARDMIAAGWEVNDGDPLMPVYPGNAQYNAARSRHFGGVNAVMCDGSVHFISNNIQLGVWQALGTMNGNETINGNW
jgi:prepilin-type N-terminal cleavage/methylation domain-containing protein